jgi:hypothetical protein
MSQLLILSSAYCAEELASEFGQIPPAFLPVGGKRLFERQRAVFPIGNAWLTVPASFNFEQTDMLLLQSLGIRTIPIKDGSTLGLAFAQCCSVLNDEPTHILFGDTLVYPNDLDDLNGNILGAGASDEEYPWHQLRPEIGGNTDQVLIGYIHVDDIMGLEESVLAADLDFIEGIYRHHRKVPWRVMENLHWLDFGHIHTYFQSKSSISTARSFNEVITSRRITHKLSDDRDKIDAEASWFENLPGQMRPFGATFAGRIEKNGKSGYCTESLYLNTLADLYVFSNLNKAVWLGIFDSCLEFLDEAAKFQTGLIEDSNSLYLEKTLSRMDRFARESNFDIYAPCVLNGHAMPSLVQIASSTADAINASAQQRTIVHGDLCFSNVFYDFRARCIKVIDPRGINAKGEHTLYGDQRYDVAKLHHSVIGGYDFIIAGRYQLGGGTNCFDFSIPLGDRRGIQEYFRRLSRRGIEYGGNSIHAISIHLFLSMLPLHADRPDRQRAFIANALRLFAELG